MSEYTGKITLINVNDAGHEPDYYIETNQPEILKFASVEETGNSSITVSPANLILRLYKKSPDVAESEILIPNVDNLSVSIYNVNSDSWIVLEDKSKIVSFVPENNNININLEAIMKYEIGENDRFFYDVFSLQETVIHLLYSYTSPEGQVQQLSTYLNVRYAMNQDMASLSIKANGIVASMQNSKLTFGAHGLTIQNGNFVIKNELENLLYADENGNLILKGYVYADGGVFKGRLEAEEGYFKGRIEANEGYFHGSGTFNGTINATEGKIGGFVIEGDRLYSKANGVNGTPSITLNGQDGIVIAENIILGAGAQIANYLKLGESVYLNNTKTDNESFIYVQDATKSKILDLKANGNMTLGTGENTLIFSGQEGYIKTQSYDAGGGWKISNNESVFNNVIIRGSIHASVLEYGEVQAVGGMLIVRPSSRIIASKFVDGKTKLILESIEGFKTGDFCRIDTASTQNFYEIQVESSIETFEENEDLIENTNNIIYIAGDLGNVAGHPIVNFGQSGAVGIGINGSANKGLIEPNSISVFEFDGKEIKPRVILGQIPKGADYGAIAGSYGLYAENVFLKGSLVTQAQTSGPPSYSGISTIYGANAPASEGFENNGEILLWAGAGGADSDHIKNAKFFVDKFGNLFAGSAKFSGPIISNAKISASEIETAILRGIGEQHALTITDATKGILFNTSQGKTVFEVSTDNLKANVPQIILNNNFKINSDGQIFAPALYTLANNQAILIEETKIGFIESFSEDKTNFISRYIDLSNGVAFSTDGRQETLILNKEGAKVKTELLLEKSTRYGDSMEYKPIYNELSHLIGCDLFIE